MTRAWVEIDLGALARNGALLASRARAPLLPMLKADAYGLGAPVVARALERLDPWGYGVATVAEGIELRDAGIGRPIICFTPLVIDDLDPARQAGLTPVMGRAADISRWHALGGGAWHLAIDTGMSRAGVRWDVVDTVRDAIRGAMPAGAFTHFHSAELDDGSMEEQERRFREAVGRLPARPALLHAENSAAIARRDRSPWDLVRPGVFLYGVGSGSTARIAPEPVVALRARIVDLRTIHAGSTVSYDATFVAQSTMRIATVAAGYADGYPRSMGGRAMALVHGRRAPVVGIVTMDMTMLDVTDVPCEIGDVATLLGRDGDEVLEVESVGSARRADPYELLTGLAVKRLPRVYIEAADS